MNKKGQVGGNIMGVVVSVAIGLVVAIITIVLGVKITSQVGSTFEPNSLEANLTTQGTGLFEDLMDNLGLIITIVIVVLVITAVAGLSYMFARR
jgi:hypothetical protein